MQQYPFFNPNAAAPQDSGIFGLPYSVNDAKLILLPVPWEATVSYGQGTANGPQAILNSSRQVDLFDLELGNIFEAGIAMATAFPDIQHWNKEARKLVEKSAQAHSPSAANLQAVNTYGAKLNHYVYSETSRLLTNEKCVGIVGGDHSSPLGAIQAFLNHYPDMGILHIDAHADMRKAYEGFEFSHASIMYNVIVNTPLKTLIQIGIRDFCEEEYYFIQQYPSRIQTFFDSVIFNQKMLGKNWLRICEEIIQPLPQQVYISFDIDGLDPRFCPHTGTPVPGGLDFHETLYLIKQIIQSGRNIIGFDLCEISPGNQTGADTEWDANVGARLLYKLCGHVLSSTK